jgi:hypothetical protein
MFASSNSGISTIVTSATIVAVGVFTVWDNRTGRSAALNSVQEKMRGFKTELDRLDGKVDILHSNSLVFTRATMKALNGDKTALCKRLNELEEICKRSGGKDC